MVSDGRQILADVDHAGDEPLMLARMLPGVPVLVGADRYLSGRFGEERLGVTVHLLDDGFQHVALFRDVDLLLADAADLTDRVLPAGRLREPLSAARAADAVLTIDAGEERIEELRQRAGRADDLPSAARARSRQVDERRGRASSRRRTLPSWPSPASLDRSDFSTISRRPAGASPALSVSRITIAMTRRT